MNKTAIIVFLALALLDPVMAAGANADISDMFASGASTASTAASTAFFFSAALGLVFTIMGFHELAKKEGQGHGKIWMLVSGGALLSIAGVIFSFSATFGLDASLGTGSSNPAPGSASGGVPILDNLRVQLGASYSVIKIMAQVVGLVMLISGFTRFVKEGKQGQISKFPYLMIVMGALLINIAPLTNVFTQTLFGTDTELFSGTTFDYQKPENSGLDERALSYLTFALTVFAIFGFIGIISGLHGLANEQSKSTGQNLIKIIGGSIAVNMEAFLVMIAKSAGVKEENIFKVILKMFGYGD